jgi:putative transposase
VNGRKRHILVDTNGLLLKIVVHAAGLSESEGGCLLLHGLAIVFPRLRHLWTDQGYKPVFVAWVEQHLGWTVEVVKPPYTPRGDTAQAMRDLLGEPEFARRYPTGFRVLPRRWVVERTLSWFGKQRRLSKDYEFLPRTTETWAYLTMSRLLLRRLAAANA